MYQKELSFLDAVKKVFLKNYCNFSGRASRSEFWWAFLAQYALSMILCFILYIVIYAFIIGSILASDNMIEDTTFTVVMMLVICIPVILFSAALFLPMYGVTVRRLHDTGRSGWYTLVSFIPLVNLILYYWLALPSEMCDNQYGPVPNIEPQPWDIPQAYPLPPEYKG